MDSDPAGKRRPSGRNTGGDAAMAMNDRRQTRVPEADLLADLRRAARQEQFLDVVSPEEARRRFHQHLDLSPLPPQRVALVAALGRVLASDVAAPLDVPAFDRSGVDGFALRSSDITGASDAAPRTLRLNAE